MVEKTQKNPAQEADSVKKEEAKKVEPEKNQPEKPQKKKKKSAACFVGALIALAVCAGTAVYCVPTLRGKAFALYEEKIAPEIASWRAKTFNGDKNAPAPEAVVEEIIVEAVPVVMPESDEEPRPVEIIEEPAPAPVDEPVPAPEYAAGQPSDIGETREMIASLAENLKKAQKTQALLEQALEKNAVLEMKLARLEAQKADASEVMTLAARLAETEKTANASAVKKEKDAVTLMALAQLQQAALAGKPFAVEQRALTRLVQGSPVLAEKIALLTPFAETGVDTRAALQESFDAFARKVVTRDKTTQEDGWFAKSVASLKSLIVIRRTDVSENATDVDSILARAEKSVDAGDLKAAVSVLKNLNNDDIAVMMPWIAAAEKTLIVQKTVDETVAFILSGAYAN